MSIEKQAYLGDLCSPRGKNEKQYENDVEKTNYNKPNNEMIN